MTKILDGKIVRDELRKTLAEQIKGLGTKPVLAIIQVGDVPSSTAYIRQKIKFGESIGVETRHLHYPTTIKTDELVSEIRKLNEDGGVGGIIVQLPLPESLPEQEILKTISLNKDVDGLVNPEVTPATARGVITLLDYYQAPLSGQGAVVIGRSNLVGKPTALALLKRGATVTVCHSKTKDMAAITKQADIVVVAIGKPRFLTSEYLKSGQVVVDVGITRVQDKLVGDVDFENVSPLVAAISPVPGGVGPLTVASLFQNLLDLIQDSKKMA